MSTSHEKKLLFSVESYVCNQNQVPSQVWSWGFHFRSVHEPRDLLKHSMFHNLLSFFYQESFTPQNIAVLRWRLYVCIEIKYSLQYEGEEFTLALYISHGASWKTLVFTLFWVLWPDESFTPKNIAIFRCRHYVCIKIKYSFQYGGGEFTPSLYICHEAS